MKRRGHRRRKRLPIWWLAAVAAAFWAFPYLLPMFLKAAAVSTMLSMPEAAIQQIAELIKAEEPSSPINDDKEEQPPAAVISLPQESIEQPTEETETVQPQEAEPQQQTAKQDESEPLAEIPKEYKGKVLSEDLSDRKGTHALLMGDFRIKNDTALPADDIKKAAESPFWIELEQTTEPQVLIYHTHATESYCPYDDGSYDTRYTWRSTDNNNNMVAVGAVMAKVLSENGIAVIQDTAQHDYPSYNGSYANSYRSVKDYLEHYPTIKVVLDVHRDAIERSSGLIVSPTVTQQGKDYAQIMLVSNCDDGSGLLPNWHKNLSFAAAFSAEMEKLVPGITRPILFSYRKYNQQLSNGALLMEFGSHANTMEQAKRSAEIAGEALAKLLNSNRKG